MGTGWLGRVSDGWLRLRSPADFLSRELYAKWGSLVWGCELVLRAFGGFGAGVEGFDDGGDAAAGAEVADDFGPDGVAGFDYVVEDLIDDVLLEDAEVAVGEEIFLEGLEFEAGLAGHVADGDAAEVGEAGFGADGGELGVVDEDLVGFE